MTLVRHALRTARQLRLAIGPLVLVASMASPLVASAAETYTETSVATVDQIVDGCEEPILLTGTLRDTFHVTETAGGAVTLMTITSAQLSGVGLESGATYRGVGVTLQPFHTSEWAAEPTIARILTSTLVDRTRIVGTGQALTLVFKTTFHITKVDEVPTVIWERTTITCA
jgi:hypothetical protein